MLAGQAATPTLLKIPTALYNAKRAVVEMHNAHAERAAHVAAHLLAAYPNCSRSQEPQLHLCQLRALVGLKIWLNSHFGSGRFERGTCTLSVLSVASCTTATDSDTTAWHYSEPPRSAATAAAARDAVDAATSAGAGADAAASLADCTDTGQHLLQAVDFT